MSFQHTTISETLKATSTAVPAQTKPRKQRKGLDRVEVSRRCELAFKAGFLVISGTTDILGINAKIIRSTCNGKLSMTFRENGVQLMIYQEDYINYYNEKYKKPTKPHYTAKQVREFLDSQVEETTVDYSDTELQLMEQLDKTLRENVELRAKIKTLEHNIINTKIVPETVSKIENKTTSTDCPYVIGKKTIPTALNKKTPVPDTWNNMTQSEQDTYLKWYIKNLLNKKAV